MGHIRSNILCSLGGVVSPTTSTILTSSIDDASFVELLRNDVRTVPKWDRITYCIVLAARKHALEGSRYFPTQPLSLTATITPGLTLYLSPTQPEPKRARNGQEALFEFRLELLKRKMLDNYERAFWSTEIVSAFFGVSANFRFLRV